VHEAEEEVNQLSAFSDGEASTSQIGNSTTPQEPSLDEFTRTSGPAAPGTLPINESYAATGMADVPEGIAPLPIGNLPSVAAASEAAAPARVDALQAKKI